MSLVHLPCKNIKRSSSIRRQITVESQLKLIDAVNQEVNTDTVLSEKVAHTSAFHTYFVFIYFNSVKQAKPASFFFLE